MPVAPRLDPADSPVLLCGAMLEITCRHDRPIFFLTSGRVLIRLGAMFMG
jgi:hypothetical protein